MVFFLDNPLATSGSLNIFEPPGSYPASSLSFFPSFLLSSSVLPFMYLFFYTPIVFLKN